MTKLRRILDAVSKYFGFSRLVRTTKDEYEAIMTRFRSAYSKAEQCDYDGAIAEVESIPDTARDAKMIVLKPLYHNSFATKILNAYNKISQKDYDGAIALLEKIPDSSTPKLTLEMIEIISNERELIAEKDSLLAALYLGKAVNSGLSDGSLSKSREYFMRRLENLGYYTREDLEGLSFISSYEGGLE